MKVTLADFVIANGYDRTLSILSEGHLDLTQQTQVVTLSRDDAPTAFPEHAVRSLPLHYSVCFPPCDSLEDAMMQSRTVPVTCPQGGVLVEEHAGVRVTYAQAWVTAIRVQRMGVTNRFEFSLMATRPDIATPSPLALMNINEVANLYAITGLTGGGATKLDGLVTADVLPGFQMDVFVSIGALNQLATFRLYEGTDATNTDPDSGPVIVRPADYATTTNEKVWKRLDA
ncbi:MAG: hypothetical protein K9N47_05510 [Prosthecobacter sp.]|uniref:hypothetical protein n=1 Tax=Prosthecobacter sp. TaxID=1965333 RepID=UPI0025D8771F|nr:hypothetical protein [Prosthecobacter sp.]MCF7785557.1 hypothetical protein [Prosthecobacter sp.]